MAKEDTYDDYMEDGGPAAAEEHKEQEESRDSGTAQEMPPEPQMGPVRRFGHFLQEKLPEWAYNAFWGTVRLIGKTIRTIVFGEDAAMRNAADSFSRTMDAERFKAEQEAKREQDKEAARDMKEEAEKDAETAKEAHKDREKGREEPGKEQEKDGPMDENARGKVNIRSAASAMGYTVKETENPDVLRLSREGKDGRIREVSVLVSDTAGMNQAQVKDHIREAATLAAAQRFLDHKGLVIAGADKDTFILHHPGGASFSFPREMLDGQLKLAAARFSTMEKEHPGHTEPVREGMFRPVTAQEGQQAPEASGKAAEAPETAREASGEAEAGSSRDGQENARETAQEGAQEASAKPERDPLLKEAAELVVSREKAGIGILQRNLHIGFIRASAIMDELEKSGIVGPEQEGTYGREILASEGDIDRLLAESAAAQGQEAGSAPAGDAQEGPVKGVPIDASIPMPDEIRFTDASDPYAKLSIAGYNVEEDVELGLVRVSDREGTAYNFASGDHRLSDPQSMNHTFASLRNLGTIQEGMVQQVPDSFGKVINQEMGGILSEYGITIAANESGDNAYVFASDGQTADTSTSWPLSQSSLALGDADGLKRILYEVQNRDMIAENRPLPNDLHAAVEAAGIVAALREKAGLAERGETIASASLELSGEGGKVEVLAQDDGFTVKEGTMEKDLPSSKETAAFTSSLSSAATGYFVHSDVIATAQSLDGFRPEPTDNMEHMMAAAMMDTDPVPAPEPEPEPEPIPEDFPFPDFERDDWPQDGRDGTQGGTDAPHMDAYDEEDLDL